MSTASQTHATEPATANEEMNRVLSKTAIDQAFRDKFLADPLAVLREEGVELPVDIDLEVIEIPTDKTVVLVPPFVGDRLDIEQLEDISGGFGVATGLVFAGATLAAGIFWAIKGSQEVSKMGHDLAYAVDYDRRKK